jgi:HrpA-like RNA helicase
VQVVIISGETGCGKTTQLPQFVLEAAVAAGAGPATNIVCTQPRRISAVSIAARVAEERGEALGHTVGYKIRLEESTSEDTRLLFCTSGVLLRLLIWDPELQHVSHVVVDEIHERGINEDLLLIILKDMLPARPDLKLILMSATLNAADLQAYFPGAAAVHIPGFTFPVETLYLEDALNASRIQFPAAGAVRPRALGTARAHTRQLSKRACLWPWLPRRVKMLGTAEAKRCELGLRVQKQGGEGRGGRGGRASPRTASASVFSNLDGTPPATLHDSMASSYGAWWRAMEEASATPSGAGTINAEFVAKFVQWLHENESDDGAILVFLSGFQDIEDTHALLQARHTICCACARTACLLLTTLCADAPCQLCNAKRHTRTLLGTPEPCARARSNAPGPYSRLARRTRSCPACCCYRCTARSQPRTSASSSTARPPERARSCLRRTSQRRA